MIRQPLLAEPTVRMLFVLAPTTSRAALLPPIHLEGEDTGQVEYQLLQRGRNPG